ncbi:MAG: 4-alpha-glucanotransferase [Tannerella sp.]|jgi:4-alpha-glucanotransferase|nr:4-alpha-glucanotransferase [Tannerella sp.]
MRIIFNLKFHTTWGQRLFIVGSCAELGANIMSAAKEMHYHNDHEWQLEISLPDSIKEVRYNYLIEDINSIRTFEHSGLAHHILFYQNCKSYYLYDYWLSEPEERAFYTSAFTKNLFVREKNKPAPKTADNPDRKNNISLRLPAPLTRPEQTVAIIGNQSFLGNWNPNHARSLSGDKFPNWEIELDSNEISFPLEYKFVVIDNNTKQICYWEEGENRMISGPPETDNSCMIVNNYPLRIPNLAWKACGVVIPVFSLRSEESFGIGDIGDIKKLIDWAKKTKQHVIQVLPMNDTTRTHTRQDSYPYSAISIYALHPLYISIPMMGNLNDKKKTAHYNKIQRILNAKDTVDYQSVETYKTAYFRDYFGQEKKNILNNNDFKEFIEKNKEWLIPYAAFSYLRDKNNTAEFSKWGDYALYNREKIEKLRYPESEAYNELSCLFFIQYTLHKQFDSISKYARKNGVVLKGDIPIGVNRESVEAWTEPDYFNMQMQTGAPPDNFSETGQNWSFPTYDWDVMGKDDFEWWKKRFHKLNNYFDCFRIDHILGFFRIWEIPGESVDGLCGHFRPALPLSMEEIEGYGMAFDKRWTEPRIHIKFIPDLFGEKADDDIYKYLNHCDSEHLVLNEICSTQRKINRLFEKNKDEKSQRTRNGLMSIANEVLFLSDPYDPKRYHPRISAHKAYAYYELSDDNRRAFDRLYHDFYFLRHNEFWKETALKRLTPLINSTEMLVCGEDLGMIPASVHEVMEKLQIFSLELEHMPKVMNCEFADLTKLPYHSVCTTSTHDMNPIRAWWKENKERTQRYYNNILQREGVAPEECSPAIAEQIICNHLRASSMLTIIPLQDWFAIDDKIRRPDAEAERINIPANPDNYWRYRMHITIETLLHANNFNKKLSNIITGNGR